MTARHPTITGWPSSREIELERRWLTDNLAAIADDFGCTVRTLRNGATKLGLPPRDPVRRALSAGADAEAVTRRDARLALPIFSFAAQGGVS